MLSLKINNREKLKGIELSEAQRGALKRIAALSNGQRSIYFVGHMAQECNIDPQLAMFRSEIAKLRQNREITTAQKRVGLHKFEYIAFKISKLTNKP